MTGEPIPQGTPPSVPVPIQLSKQAADVGHVPIYATHPSDVCPNARHGNQQGHQVSPSA